MANGGTAQEQYLGIPATPPGGAAYSRQIITRRLNDPHIVIGITNAQHIINKTWTHWGEGNMRKRTPVIHHQVCDA